MVKKKLIALIMLVTMSLGTVANAKETTEEGYSNVLVQYSSVSTFTVVLPDSIALNSDKTQEFEIYLSDYELNDGDKVRVKPINDKFTMEYSPKEISYYVGDDANSYDGLPEFPTYRKSGIYYNHFSNYILAKGNSGYTLYCVPEGENIRLYADNINKDNSEAKYQIKYNGCEYSYHDSYSSSIAENTYYNYPDGSNFPSYTYDAVNNEWVDNGYDKKLYDSETIIQSTLPIYVDNTDELFVQYIDKEKDAVDVPINMSGEYLTDSTPITGSIDGSALSSGDWLGEVVFEITLVN